MVKVAFFDLGTTLVKPTSGRDEWISGAEGVLDDLRGRGLLLGIISNTSNLTRGQLLDVLPSNFTFDRFEPTLVILSSETEPPTQKPDPEIFALALARAAAIVPGLEDRECLFCVEKLSEAVAASAAGFTVARVLTPSDQSDIATVPSVLSALNLVGELN